MRSFVKYLIGFCFLFLVITTCLDFIYTNIYARGNTDSTLRRAIGFKDQKWDVVFFGSSRVVNNIDCKLITELTGKSCLNMGVMGSTSKNDAIIFEILLKNNKIEKAFFQVDYKYNNLILGKRYAAELVPFEENIVVDHYLRESRADNWLWYFPFYKYMVNDKVLGFRRTYSTVIKHSNKRGLYGFRPVIGVGTDINVGLPISYTKNSNSYLYENINGSDGVAIHYFTAPFCKDIRNRDAMQVLNSFFDNYVDYTKIYDDKQEYFNDCLHLNNVGASSFSKLLAEEIF